MSEESTSSASNDFAKTPHTNVVPEFIPPNPLAHVSKVFPNRDSTTKVKTPSIAYRIKEWAWRSSALYFWIWFAADLFGQRGRFAGFTAAAMQFLRNMLEQLGFLPTDPTYFPLVVKASWLLALTEFSLIQF